MRRIRTAVIRTLVAGVVVAAGMGPLAAAPAHAGGPQLYQAVDLGFVGRSTAINDKRQVVGELIVGTGFDIRRHPFLWERGRYIDLGLLATGDFEHGVANDINNRGQVVGQSAVAPGVQHAFLWEDGVMTDLGTLGGEWSAATRINDRGQVIGFSQNAAGEWRPFRWQNGVMTDLGPGFANDINERGQIVGARWFGDIYHAVLFENGEVTVLDQRRSSARAINNAGTVVGHLNYDETETSEAYLWRGGRAVNIGAPEWNIAAVDINGRGEVLMGTLNRLVLWRDGVQTRLDEVGVSATAASVAELNNRGDIVASADQMDRDEHAVVYLRRR